MLPLPYKYQLPSTASIICRDEMNTSDLSLCRKDMASLEMLSLPYPQLIDNILTNYQSISEPRNILKMGAYSLDTATALFMILNKYCPLLEQAITQGDSTASDSSITTDESEISD